MMVESGTEVTMRGMKLIFLNFKGEASKFNSEGERNFGVLLDEEPAMAMQEDGWNVKFLKPREDAEEEETGQYWLPVKVKFSERSKPPRIVLVTEHNRQILDESDVKMVDMVDIENVDLIIRAYQWDVQGKQGISAYLKTAYITIVEDELDKQYRLEDQ